jgi:hypothetical protein
MNEEAMDRGGQQHHKKNSRTHELTNFLTSWSYVLEKLIVSQVVRKFLTFYANQMFITAFIRARHLFLS